jgi:hypothetical protein
LLEKILISPLHALQEIRTELKILTIQSWCLVALAIKIFSGFTSLAIVASSFLQLFLPFFLAFRGTIVLLTNLYLDTHHLYHNGHHTGETKVKADGGCTPSSLPPPFPPKNHWKMAATFFEFLRQQSLSSAVAVVCQLSTQGKQQGRLLRL